MPSAPGPRPVHRVPGQARHHFRGAVLYRVHGDHAARVAHSHQPGHRQIQEEQHGLGQERHLQKGVQLVLHSDVHMRAAPGAGRAQLVPDQRGQPEPQEPDAAHLPGKNPTFLFRFGSSIDRDPCAVFSTTRTQPEIQNPLTQERTRYFLSRATVATTRSCLVA